MRIALVTSLLAAVVGCGVGTAARNAEPAPADLKITVWPEGRGEGSSKTYTLECGPARGSLPKTLVCLHAAAEDAEAVHARSAGRDLH